MRQIPLLYGNRSTVFEDFENRFLPFVVMPVILFIWPYIQTYILHFQKKSALIYMYLKGSKIAYTNGLGGESMTKGEDIRAPI